MTAPLTVDDRELIERLRTMCSHRGDGIATQFVNPDGPEAADRIEALEQRARLDTATVDAVLKAVENRSVPTMDATWSAAWNCAMDFVSKAIIEARAALIQTEVP